MRIPRILTALGVALMAFVFVGSVVRAGQKLAGATSVKIAKTTSVEVTPLAPDGVQRVTLAFANGNYTPRVIRVRKGIPTEIVGDLSKLRGCFASFAVPDLNLWTQFTAQNDRLAFVPDRVGTFRFSCAMGMGNGTLVVES